MREDGVNGGGWREWGRMEGMRENGGNEGEWSDWGRME